MEQVQNSTPWAKVVVQRSGRAKRPDNFADLVKLAETWEPQERISCRRVNKVIQFGLRDLTPTEKNFLAVAVNMISDRALKKGRAYCYLSGYSFRRVLGRRDNPLHKRTLAQIKRSLEERHLIIRHFDNRNQPEEDCAIDLRPFFARLDELEEGVDDFFDETRDYFAQQRELDRFDYDEDEIRFMEGCDEIHPNRLTPTKVKTTVQSEKESPASPPITNSNEGPPTPDQHPETTNPTTIVSSEPNSADCSPKGASEFWKGCGKVGSYRRQKAISQLSEAHSLCETWAGNVPLHAIESGDENAILAGTYQFIEEQLDDRNTDQTFYWAVKKYGWKAVIMLVSAVEDETVLDPMRYFGAMATKLGDRIDLNTNLARIRKQQERRTAETDNPSPSDTETPSNPEERGDNSRPAPQSLDDLAPEDDLLGRNWKVIKDHLGQKLDPSEIRSWINPIVPVVLNAHTVRLAVPSRFIREWVVDNYQEILEKACAEVLGSQSPVQIDIGQPRVKH